MPPRLARRCLLCSHPDVESVVVSNTTITIDCAACGAMMRLEYAPPDDPRLTGRIEVLIEPFSRRRAPARADCTNAIRYTRFRRSDRGPAIPGTSPLPRQSHLSDTRRVATPCKQPRWNRGIPWHPWTMAHREPDPACPQCGSALTERLPFSVEHAPNPVYRCLACDHVWRVPQPGPLPKPHQP